MNIISVVPARSQSKGIPNKNMQLLCSKPLISFTIEASIACKLIARTIVSTDSSEIAQFSQDTGAEIVNRPSELATDCAPTIAAVLHVFDKVSLNNAEEVLIVLLQPTSPLRTTHHIEQAIDEFLQHKNAKSLISVTPSKIHPYKTMKLSGTGHLLPLFSVDGLSTPRQKLPEIYAQNGAIYVCRLHDLIQFQSFYIEPCIPFRMFFNESIDIDDIQDLKLAESLIRS